MDKCQEAYRDYQAGMKCKEIAEKYRIPLNTVKTWLYRKWKLWATEEVATGQEKKLQLNEKKLQPDRKPKGPGVPKGNQNAVGNHGGAPKGNQNNLRHGLYQKLDGDNFLPDEFQLLDCMDIDVVDELIHMYNDKHIQEVRMRGLIKKAKDSPGGLAVSGVSSSKYANKDGEPGGTATTTTTVATYELILKCQAALDRIQKEKIKILEVLNRIDSENENGEVEDDGFIEALKGEVSAVWDDVKNDEEADNKED